MMNWVPRQRGGGRGQPGYQPRPPYQPQYQPVVPQPRGGLPPMRGRGNPAFNRGGPPNRGRGQQPDRAGGGAGAGAGIGGGAGVHHSSDPNNVWDSRPYKLPKDVKLHWENLGIEQGGCFACGAPTHSYWKKECPYYGTPLFPNKCRNCGIGAHKHTLCVAKKSGEIKKQKHVRAATLEEIQEDPFDWMMSEN